jgi:hypothetical protein
MAASCSSENVRRGPDRRSNRVVPNEVAELSVIPSEVAVGDEVEES